MKLLTITFLTLFTQLLFAQNEPITDKWRWVQFSTEDGLPSRRINAVFESSSGTIWVVTPNGLAWYDDFRWNAIDSSTGLPQSGTFNIVGEYKDSIVVLLNDRIFIGTTSGFFRVLPFHDIITALSFTDSSILIAMDDTLFLYNNEHLKPFSPSLPFEPGSFGKLVRTTFGKIWLGYGLKYYRLDRDGWKDMYSQSLNSPVHFEHFIEDTSGNGLAMQTGFFNTFEWKHNTAPRVGAFTFSTFIKAIVVGAQNEIVAITQSDEIQIRRHGAWSSIMKFPIEIHHINTVTATSKGDIWIGTEEGLFLCKLTSRRWELRRHPGADFRNYINEILITRDTSVWLGTAAGIEIINKDGSAKTITHINTKRITAVTGIAEDRDGNIWISSGSAFPGAYRWNGTDWKFYSITDDSIKIYPHKIRKDLHGRLWFLGLSKTNNIYSTKKPGAYVYDYTRFTRWGVEEGLQSGRVYAFAQTEDSSYWFGTVRGISKFKKGRWIHWNEKQLFGNSRIFTIAPFHNSIWFGNEHTGVGIIDEDDNISKITVSDGLVDKSVKDIRYDDEDRLWITTLNGLGYFDNGTWSSFTVKNGLPSPWLWPVTPAPGKVYIGTMGEGLGILHLDEQNDPAPKVSIDNPVIEEHEVLIRWHAFPYRGEQPSGDVQTRYRLNNDPWSSWNTTRDVLFPDLPSETYTFTVQSKSLFGRIGEGSNVSFTVPVPLHHQPLVLILGSSIFLIIIVLGLNQVIRKRRHDAALRESEAKFRRLTEAAFEGIIIHDKGIVVETNPSILNLLGYTPSDIIGKPIVDFIANKSQLDMHRVTMIAEIGPMETEFLRKDRSVVTVEIVSKLISQNDKMLSVMAIRDITERKHAEKKLLAYQSELRNLAAELSISEQQERTKIAAYLHDEIGHMLLLCKMKLDHLHATNELPELEDITTTIQKTIENTRSLTSELSPPAIHELNFNEALEWLVGQLQEQYDLLILYQNRTPELHLEKDLRIFLFQSVRELLMNVIRHAMAHSAEVIVHLQHSLLTIEVKDDGVGFNTAPVANGKKHNGGFGLFHIRERLRHYGGTLEIQPKEDAPSCVTIQLPFRNPANGHINPTTP